MALGGRTLDAAGFTAITSSHLLLNVVGRGLCSASELELTRSVAHAGREQVEAGGVCRARIRHTAVMVGLATVAVLAAAPLLDRVFGGDPVLVALLALSLPGMAASHVLRGPLAGTRRYHPLCRYVRRRGHRGARVRSHSYGAADCRCAVVGARARSWAARGCRSSRSVVVDALGGAAQLGDVPGEDLPGAGRD